MPKLGRIKQKQKSAVKQQVHTVKGEIEVKKNKLGKGIGRPFKKGQSGNPNGRPPKGMSLTETLRNYLEGKDEATGKTRRDIVSETLWELAIKKKDVQALKYLHDRLDGTPRQTIEHGGMQGMIQINFDKPYDEL